MSPSTFIFLNDWNGSVKTSFFVGLKVGFFCLGCCWLLMMLAFVGGVMNLGFMGLATLVMIAEKLPVFGRYVTLPLSFFTFDFWINSCYIEFNLKRKL